MGLKINHIIRSKYLYILGKERRDRFHVPHPAAQPVVTQSNYAYHWQVFPDETFYCDYLQNKKKRKLNLSTNLLQ